MKRIGDEVSGGARRMWHPAPSKPTADGEGEEERPRNGMCAAYGCPLPGGMSTGGDRRYCWLHFGAGLSDNDRITSWLRANPLAVEAMWVTQATSPHAIRNLAERLRRAGLDDLAPRVVTLTHDGYGRHADGVAVTRDEHDYPALYAQRVRGWVSAAIGARRAAI
jgi:hypothetical protein